MSDKKKYFTAFVVLVDEDGSVMATSDLETSGIEVDHEASLSDMRKASSEVIHDINSMHTAQQVVNAIAMQARAAAEAQQNQKIAAKLQERLVVPGK